jgi:dGTPase
MRRDPPQARGPFVGKRIGRYIQSASLATDVNFLSAETHRYHYRLCVDPEVAAESALVQETGVRGGVPLAAVEATGAQGQHGCCGACGRCSASATSRRNRIDGQDFQLLPADTAAEIAAAPDEAARARLVCDFLAGMTDGYAARTYKRLFSPDFGSIGDLIG